MKNLSLMFGVALMSSTMMAQNVYVHTNDGSAYEYEVKDVDSIDFKLGASKLAAPSTDSECEKRLNDPEFLLDAIARMLQEKSDENMALSDSIKKMEKEIISLRKQLDNCSGGSDTTSSGCQSDKNAVDLGLSIKWATMNVGATKPSDMGNHYSWGETEPTDNEYDYYGWSASKLIKEGVMTADSILTPEHDVATVNWGDCWRMPTNKEVYELYDNCTWERTQVDGMTGYLVTGPNGNSIFMPAVGVKKTADSSPTIGEGYYWSSCFSPKGDEYAESYVMFSDETRVIHWRHTRFDGVVIRPVMSK